MRFGQTSVTRVAEAEGPKSRPGFLFPEFDRIAFAREMDWLAPGHYLPETDQLISSFHSWLIRTPSLVVLVDTCAGNDKERPGNPAFHLLATAWPARLAAAGVAPEQVDVVLCTHLHADHCGWNTRLLNGRWIPTFPNARYLFSRIELERADTRGRALPDDDPNAGVFEDSVLPILEAGQAVPIDGVYTIDDTLFVEPAPGHTAGSVVLRLRDGFREAVFTGDIMHHPIQVVHPGWNSRFCDDPLLARATRRRLLEECRDRDVTLFPGHFAAPYCGCVVSGATGFGFRFGGPSL